jgi:hypothetical protein
MERGSGILTVLFGLVLTCASRLALAAPAAPAPADELAQRQAVRVEVITALTINDFAGIERLAARYRDPRERTSSGLWKLTLFYGSAREYLGMLADCAGDPAPVDALLATWAAAVPDSPTLLLLRTRNQLCVAQDTLQAQGNDPRAWAAYTNLVHRLDRDLEAHRSLAATDPYWLETRLALTDAMLMSSDETRFDGVLAQLATHHPPFYQAWFTAVELLLFRKSGDAGAMIERLSARAADASRADEGDGMYARMWWNAFQLHYDDASFAQAPVDWPRMKRGIADVLARYPDAWNRNFFARLACARGDAAETAALMRGIDAPLRNAWPDAATFAACRDGRAFGATTASL